MVLPPDATQGIQRKADELHVSPPEDLEFQFDRDPSSRPPPPEQDYVDNPGEFLARSGLLFELNRRLLHPLGLALEVVLPEEGGDVGSFRIWDCRKDPAGVVFTDEGFIEGLRLFMQFMDTAGTKRLLDRQACQGFRVQGEP